MAEAVRETESQVFAANLLAQLVACGVEHVYLAPGSRSQALAIAANQLAVAGKLKLHIRLDERSLAFQALGAARASNKPVAVITTSGTAVANLYPAVLEAFHTSTPLLLLTADRPHALRNTGSNQTTLQNDIFGHFVLKCFDIDASAPNTDFSEIAKFAKELAVDAVAVSLGHAREHAGPVQLNLGFREPLSSTQPNAAEVKYLLAPTKIESHSVVAEIDLSLNTLVIAGDQANKPSEFDVSGLPVFAEPTSGLTTSQFSIPTYREALARYGDQAYDFENLEQVVVLGKPTLSREIQKLIRVPGLKVYSIPGSHRDFKPTPETIQANRLDRKGEPNPEWFERFKYFPLELQDSLRISGEKLSTIEIARSVRNQADENDRLILGASTVIRDFERAGLRFNGEVFANRGLAGIDGTIAFASGIADTDPAQKVIAVVGDLTALHDVGSLAYGDSDDALNFRLIVVNNRGGAIFDRLEVRELLDDESFEKLFSTPQHVNFEALAAAYSWQYQKVTNQFELNAALEMPGRVLVEAYVEK